MEYLLASTVIGAGYLLGTNGKNERDIDVQNIREEHPSETNIYKSNYSRESREQDVLKRDKRYNDSRNAIETNIIPPQFNNKIINSQSNPIKYLQEENDINSSMSKNKKNLFVSTLSGKVMRENEFRHNNMTPFFGGSVKQNTYEHANQPILELYTGFLI